MESNSYLFIKDVLFFDVDYSNNIDLYETQIKSNYKKSMIVSGTISICILELK